MTDLHTKLANSHSKLMRGQVWCRSCGATQRVDPVACFRLGWPKCCNATMTIDAPDERSTWQQPAVSRIEHAPLDFAPEQEG